MLGYTRIIYRTFSKYFRPLHKLLKAADVIKTTDNNTDHNRQNSKITDMSDVLSQKRLNEKNIILTYWAH